MRYIEHSTSESRKQWMLRIFRASGQRNKRNKQYQFWRQDNQPKELATSAFMDQKLRYIHDNPVKAGLVLCSEHYKWSSAGEYAGGTGLVRIKFLD